MRAVAEDDERGRRSVLLAGVLIAVAVLGLLLIGVVGVGAIVRSNGPDEAVCKPRADVVLAKLMTDLRRAVGTGPVLLSQPASCVETSSGYALEEKWQVDDTLRAVATVRASLATTDGWSGDDRSFVGDRDGVHILAVVNVENEEQRPIVASHDPGVLVVSLSEDPRS